MISLQITPEGGVQMLQDDAVDLRHFGQVHVERASHVEFDDMEQKWYCDSAKTGRRLGYFETRAEALSWEKKYYSPGGGGWKELVR